MLFKHYSKYVQGAVGADFKLSFWKKLRLLFCKKISVVFFNERLKKDGVNNAE